ncbi:urea transporter 1 [Alosa sapidissima]|uniref:urea transporter 1 n=1 Tax=Alosa sapidissima TaxID=34773 RepID=UPI001C09B0C8|nr:urea transporter 1 [Alosa sapidissima]
MWTPEKAEGPARGHAHTPARSSRQRVISVLLYCTGEMSHFSKIMEDKPFPVQLVEWVLRGVSRVILANNPVSGALILGALVMASPWQALMGTVGLLASTLTAIIIGQDSAEIAGGLHGFNGMLVALLMAVFSAAGDWYWWLLLPACLGGATCTFLFSGLAPLLDRWDLPVAVFPFNMVIVLFLACTGPNNPYFPHNPAAPPGAPEGLNHTQLLVPEVLQGVVLGVGQIYACSAFGSSLLILGGVLIFSPIMAIHALLGSGIGTLVGLSMAVQHSALYSGLSGFNGALGCMAVGGLFFTFSWKTHLFAIASGFLSAYTDIALSNLLGTVGLPACSWGATLIATLMLLLTARHLSVYRITIGQVGSPEHNLLTHRRWEEGAKEDSTDV